MTLPLGYAPWSSQFSFRFCGKGHHNLCGTDSFLSELQGSLIYTEFISYFKTRVHFSAVMQAVVESPDSASISCAGQGLVVGNGAMEDGGTIIELLLGFQLIP